MYNELPSSACSRLSGLSLSCSHCYASSVLLNEIYRPTASACLPRNFRLLATVSKSPTQYLYELVANMGRSAAFDVSTTFRGCITIACVSGLKD